MSDALRCNGCGAGVVLHGPGSAQTEVECGDCGYRMVADTGSDQWATMNSARPVLENPESACT